MIKEELLGGLALKIYQINIRPLTGFGSPIKGDTLFGQLCWQIYYDPGLLGKSLEVLLSDYSLSPFLIVSSAFPVIEGKIYLKTPFLPLHFLFKKNKDELIRERKELKEKKYFPLDLPLYFVDNSPFEKLENIIRVDEQVRASIHRLTNTTGEAPFTPYPVKKIWYLTELALFCGLRDGLPLEGLIEALRRVGLTGYGKDASVGLGKFEVLSWREIDFYDKVKSFNAYYTLSPSLPDLPKEKYKRIYYEPFVRFGRHGDQLSCSPNPFKAPLLLAEEGAIYVPQDADKRLFLGRAIKGHSSIEPNTVHQGYSLVIPVKVPEEAAV